MSCLEKGEFGNSLELLRPPQPQFRIFNLFLISSSVKGQLINKCLKNVAKI